MLMATGKIIDKAKKIAAHAMGVEDVDFQDGVFVNRQTNQTLTMKDVALRAANPTIAYCDTSRRGYTSLQLTPDGVEGHWHFLRTVRERDTTVTETVRRRVGRGRRVLQEV